MQDLPEHGVTTVFVELSNTKLELLHPLGEKSPIAGFLEKNKTGGIHHICIEVFIHDFYLVFMKLNKCFFVICVSILQLKYSVTFQCQYFFMFFLQVNDIHAAVSDVKSKNIRCLSPEPRIGAHGKPVMFLHPKVVRWKRDFLIITMKTNLWLDQMKGVQENM